MIFAPLSAHTCERCGERLELRDAYAIHEGRAEAEAIVRRCPACGRRVEEVVPVDGEDMMPLARGPSRRVA